MRGYNRRPAEYRPYDEKGGESPVIVYSLLVILGLTIIFALLI